MHAYFLALVDDTTITGSSEVPEYNILWQNLYTKLYDNSPNLIHHTEMIRSFVDPIAEALKEWDNGAKSDIFYEDLAFGGLIQTPSFGVLFPPGSPNRIRIISVNGAEDTNSSQGNISAQGQPCN